MWILQWENIVSKDKKRKNSNQFPEDERWNRRIQNSCLYANFKHVETWNTISNKVFVMQLRQWAHLLLPLRSGECQCEGQGEGKSCPARQRWDDELCGCVCAEECPRNQPLNPDTCRCQCRESPQTCLLQGKRFDKNTCRWANQREGSKALKGT